MCANISRKLNSLVRKPGGSLNYKISSKTIIDSLNSANAKGEFPIVKETHGRKKIHDEHNNSGGEGNVCLLVVEINHTVTK